jgi:hypothetical protein
MPVANKTYTDIRFFLKTPETIRAFTQIPFNGTVRDPEEYPNADFDNVELENEPYIDLPTLEANFRLIAPEYIDMGEADPINTTTITGTFDNVSEDNYLLYRFTGEGEGTLDELKVYGYIATKVDNTEVTLSAPPPAETIGIGVELYSWTGEVDATTLKALNFNFADNFYMAVKNVDYVAASGKHDAVLNIDTSRTSNNYNNSPQVFAYSSSKIINPNFFSLQRISKSKNPIISDVDITNIPCSIVGITKWSEPEKWAGELTAITEPRTPFWSVYEINPKFTSADHLDKNTFYRLVINDVLPSAQIYVNVATPEE